MNNRGYDVPAALKAGGFEFDGRWNSLIERNGHLYRKKAEMLIIKGRSVFLAMKDDGKGYGLPGGSVEKDLPDIQQVVNECHEEAYIDPTRVRFMEGCHYSYLFSSKISRPEWMYKLPIRYDGVWIDVYCGMYNRPYTGYVDTKDQSQFVKEGKWVNIDKAMSILRPEHKRALLNYLKEEKIELTAF